ncbi:obtusifoliol 14-alpha demethylase-like [Triticum urartu]|uniref:Obtusifoliol 14-alpha demethylase n=1 Tax=Triticum urartu TaxID=4572 RepID=A0A8R7VD03_TRIUA|nr:obtusifoliol 14-alpha demethylase-like [Triticum urartu]
MYVMDWAAASTTLFSVVLFSIVTVVAAKLLKAENKFNNHVYTRPLPPVVNVLALIPPLLNKGLQATIQDLYTKFGSVFTINFLGPKVTLLIGPEVSAHFFQGLDSEISWGNLLEFTIPMYGQEVGYGVDTATRNEHSNFIIQALQPSKLRSHVDPIFQEVEAYFAKWGLDGTVDLKHELEQVLMLTSSRCLLADVARHQMILTEIYSLLHELENGANIISFLFPYIPTPTNRRRDKAHIKLKEIFSAAVRSRSQAQEDALQRLIDSKYKDGRPTTIAEISGMMIILISTSRHTSSHTSIWTGARLLSNTKFLKVAVEEQKHIICKYGNQIDHHALSEMDTLHNCIKEALRMHPAGPVLFRKAHKTFNVHTKEGNEYGIPGGHNVIIPTVFNSKLPYIYKDPGVYDPDRFSPGRQEDKVGGKFSYTSFGGGRHICPGMAFAYLQIKLIWSHLLRNFELELMSSFPKADWSKITPAPKGKVMISYKRRQLH